MAIARRAWTIGLAALAAFVLAVGVGRALTLGPGSLTAPSQVQHHAAGETESEASAALSNGTYSLELADTVVPIRSRRIAFTIRDLRNGSPLTRYEIDMTKRLHLIAVRADGTGFQHVHPRLRPDGRWDVSEAVFDRAGPWRLIADFIPAGGERTVLATNLHVVGGTYDARPLVESPSAGETAWRSRTGEYEITAEATSYTAGGEGKLRFLVRHRGRPFTDLQPYLGALGHCVLLRSGDLSYVHVHPTDSTASGPTIEFETSYPAGARLAVFLQFRHRSKVQTAAFRLPAPPAG